MKGLITYEKCYEAAKKFETIKDFREAYKSTLYSAACKNGWLKNFTWLKRKKTKAYTYEEYISIAKQFKYSSDFRAAHSSLWAVGHNKGWHKDCTWFEKKPKEYVYTHDLYIETAKKYNNSSDFKKRNPALYNAGTRNGWIKEITWFERRKKYTKEQIIEIASKYKTTADFWKNEPKYCDYAKRQGWFEDLPLEKVRKDTGFWQKYENNYNEAIKYTTLKDFQDNAGAAYSVARENGWIDSYTWLKRTSKPNGYWNTYENNREEAMKYKTRTDFARTNQAAYEWARKNDWLDTYEWLKIIPINEYKFNLLEEFVDEFHLRDFLMTNDENIIYIILRNIEKIEPKYNPIIRDIDKALHTDSNDPIKDLEDKYRKTEENDSKEGYVDTTTSNEETTTSVVTTVDLDDEDAVDTFINSTTSTFDKNDDKKEPTIEDLTRARESEIKIINEIEHMITPEDLKSIMSKFLNDKRREWIKIRDRK